MFCCLTVLAVGCDLEQALQCNACAGLELQQSSGAVWQPDMCKGPTARLSVGYLLMFGSYTAPELSCSFCAFKPSRFLFRANML